MHRRYSIHKDGDLLVEDLDAQGNPIDPEPVANEDRLPVHLILHAPNDSESRSSLLDLLEMALDMESEGTSSHEGLTLPPKSEPGAD